MDIFQKGKLKNDIQYELLLLPALIGFFLFFLLPAVQSVIYSFTNYSMLNKSISFIGLQNYFDVFKDQRLIASIKNTLQFALGYTLLQNLLAIPLAVALDTKIRSKNILRMIFFMPAIFSSLIIGYLWSFILSSSSSGLLNYTLHEFGLGFLAKNWLGDPNIALLTVILVSVWQSAGWAMIIYIANLQGVPEEIYESAKIDGANKLQTFWYITIRFLAPAITINLMMSMINGLKVYDQIVALTNGGPGYATETLTSSIISYGFIDQRYGYASALSVLMLIIIMTISMIQLKFLSKNEESLS